MIVFTLKCKDCSYEFEAWFSNSKEFEKQQKKSLISCPDCNSSLVIKSLMSPNVSKKSNSKVSKQKKTMINNLYSYK